MSTSNRNDTRNDDDESSTQHPLVPTGLLPAYLAEAFGEIYEEDGLLVLGKGLGLLPLLAAFVRFYGDVEEGYSADSNAKKPPLVFVLGLKDNERNALVSILETWGTPPHLLPTMVTNESGQGKDRAGRFLRGFCNQVYLYFPGENSLISLSSLPARWNFLYNDAYSYCRPFD